MNLKVAACYMLVALLILFAGFRLGITIFKSQARAYIIYDTVYIDSFAGEKLTLLADQTLRPRQSPKQ